MWCFWPIACKYKVGRDYKDLLLQVKGIVKIIFGDQEMSLFEELLQTIVDRLQCLHIYIHIGQLATANCHYIKLTSSDITFQLNLRSIQWMISMHRLASLNLESCQGLYQRDLAGRLGRNFTCIS